MFNGYFKYEHCEHSSLVLCFQSCVARSDLYVSLKNNERRTSLAQLAKKSLTRALNHFLSRLLLFIFFNFLSEMWDDRDSESLIFRLFSSCRSREMNFLVLKPEDNQLREEKQWKTCVLKGKFIDLLMLRGVHKLCTRNYSFLWCFMSISLKIAVLLIKVAFFLWNRTTIVKYQLLVNFLYHKLLHFLSGYLRRVFLRFNYLKWI